MAIEEQVYQLIQESQEGKRDNSGLLNHTQAKNTEQKK
jgi:hypothetical protein